MTLERITGLFGGTYPELASCTVCGSVQRTSTEAECGACITRDVVDTWTALVLDMGRVIDQLTKTVEKLSQRKTPVLDWCREYKQKHPEATWEEAYAAYLRHSEERDRKWIERLSR